MATLDPRVDSYISRAAGFAQPILSHLRRVVHDACPRVQETIKWGFPHFTHEGMLCSMAAFKHHCAFGFWKHALLLPEGSKRTSRPAQPAGLGMGHFGRITALSDLPSEKSFTALVRKAASLNEAGVKRPTRPRTQMEAKAPHPSLPGRRLEAEPARPRRVRRIQLQPQEGIVEWLTEAKTEPTRQKRLATTLAWLADGKSRNWKYEGC